MAKRALEGIKVIDLTWSAAGPLACKYLADNGATVIKVETARLPDPVRRIPPWKDDIQDPDYAAWFAYWNSSKYSVALDLNHPRSKSVIETMIKWADIIVESFTPGTMEKWDLDYERVATINPRIIMLRTSMLGQTGPLKSHLGYGNTLQYYVGIGHLTGWPDREPVGTGVAYTDYYCCHLAAIAIMSAMIYRRKTGKGQLIDFSQMEGSISCLGTAILDWTVNSREQCRMGNRLPYAAPHGCYRCKGEDRWCVIAVFTDDQWRAFCEVIGKPELVSDPKYSYLQNRKSNEDELDQLIESWTIQYSPHEVMNRVQGAGVEAGVVQTSEDLLNDPQLAYRNHFRRLNHPVIGMHSYDSVSFRFSETNSDPWMPGPLLGQHNEYIYKELLGMSDEDYNAYLSDGVFE